MPTQPSSCAFNVSNKSTATCLSASVAGSDLWFRKNISFIIGLIMLCYSLSYVSSYNYRIPVAAAGILPVHASHVCKGICCQIHSDIPCLKPLPRAIQPTTFGEIGGRKSSREEALAYIFRKSHIPYQIVPEMHHWQISHLGVIIPLADAYYQSRHPVKKSVAKFTLIYSA